MKKRVHIAAFLALLAASLWGSSVCTAAPGDVDEPARLTAVPYVPEHEELPHPSEAGGRYPSQVVWRFDNTSELDTFLSQCVASSLLTQSQANQVRLRAKTIENVTPQDRTDARLPLQGIFKGIYSFWTEAELRSLPPDFVGRATHYLMYKRTMAIGPFLRFDGPEVLERFEAKNPFPAGDDWKKNLITLPKETSDRERRLLVITKAIVQAMSGEEAQKVRRASRFLEGYRVTLLLKSGEDVGAIARQFAGHRDPASIERYLRALLKKSGGAEVQVPLEKILEPFIRQTHGTYPDPKSQRYSLDGPNCFNCALSVNDGKDYDQKFVHSRDLGERIQREYTGDLIGQWDPEMGEVVHAFTYIGEAQVAGASQRVRIVYTKNGTSYNHPYLFADGNWIADIYTGSMPSKFITFRKKKSVFEWGCLRNQLSHETK